MKKIFVYAFALALMVSCGGSGSKSTTPAAGGADSKTEKKANGGEGMDDVKEGFDKLKNGAKKAKEAFGEEDYDGDDSDSKMSNWGGAAKAMGKAAMGMELDEDDASAVMHTTGDMYGAMGKMGAATGDKDMEALGNFGSEVMHGAGDMMEW